MSNISQLTGINNTRSVDQGYSNLSRNKKAEQEAQVNSLDVAAVFEKSKDTENDSTKQIYSVNKMSKEDRDALIQKLESDLNDQVTRMKDLVSETLNDQVKAFGVATNDDDIWSLFSKGDLSTVSDAAKAQAKEDISENGYFGVKQTSERLFDYASALAGDDTDKMKDMQDAIEKGYKEATKSWGKELPEISKNTLDATNSLFDDYFKSMGIEA
ncbi:MAG: hypothetical protein K5931_07585 [Lachnospiraceae bacterium]|nr:hypothetical protein [Lachnospiraceae bacterium]